MEAHSWFLKRRVYSASYGEFVRLRKRLSQCSLGVIRFWPELRNMQRNAPVVETYLINRTHSTSWILRRHPLPHAHWILSVLKTVSMVVPSVEDTQSAATVLRQTCV